jgi:hypothetical protein
MIEDSWIAFGCISYAFIGLLKVVVVFHSAVYAGYVYQTLSYRHTRSSVTRLERRLYTAICLAVVAVLWPLMLLREGRRFFVAYGRHEVYRAIELEMVNRYL